MAEIFGSNERFSTSCAVRGGVGGGRTGPGRPVGIWHLRAHHVPQYTAQALRARGKRAVVLGCQLLSQGGP